MPSLRTPSRVVAGLLLGAALSSCTSFVSGMGESANAALEEALRVGVEGFQTADAPAPPTEICESSSDPAPEVDATLRQPASAGYTDGDAELHAWAWRTTSSEQADRIVDRAVDGADACEQELYADYDTDGDGRIDSGSHTATTAGRYDRYGWRGVAVGTEEDGDPTVVTRYVRMDDVVVLVMLTGGGDDASATVDDYLAALAAAL